MKFVIFGTAAAILALTFTAITVEPRATDVVFASIAGTIQ